MSRRNENRPGYKKTKVGWIPEEWECVRLKEVSDINPEALSDKTDQNYMFHYIDLSTVNEGKLKLPSNKITFREAPSRARRKVKKNDVLLATVRPNLKGFAYISFEANDIVCSTGYAVLRSKNEVISLYLFYNLFSHETERYFYSCVVGSNYPALNNSDVNNLRIPLPPLPEQKKIAEILSAWDRAIEQVGRLIDAKQRLKKGLMQQLLTGRMRFPEFNHETHERHEKDKGELPVGWKRVRLKDVCKVAYGKDWKTVACSERAYPVYGTGGVIGYASSPLYSGPSILLGRKGTIDNPVYINSPFWAVDTTFYTEIKKEMDPKFIFFLFCCIHWHRYNEASGVPSLSRNTLEKIKLALPSFDEQRRIAAVLSTCDREIELLKKKQEKLKEQKKGLIQKLLTGEVRVKI